MTVTDRTDATEQEFRSRIAAFESAPTPPEVREAQERTAAARFRLLDALWPHPVWAFNGSQIACGCDHYFRSSADHREHLADVLLPAAAVAAYRAQDGGAEEAVRRVEALVEELERDARTDRETVLWVTNAFRAALAPQAER